MNYFAEVVAFLFAKPTPSVSVVDRVQAIQDVGIVTETIHPGYMGRVEYRASDWNAVCFKPVALLPGTRIRVIQIVNITLVVESITTEPLSVQSSTLDQKVA